MRSSALVSGRTRWRRFAALFVPALSVVAVVMAMMATGVVAIPIAISGTMFTVSASSLVTGTTTDRTEFTQYGSLDFTDPGNPATETGVGVNVIKHADLTNLDQVVCGPTPVTKYTGKYLQIEIKAPTASADNLVVDATSLTGDATFTDIQIGVPAPAGVPDPGAVGSFAQVANKAVIGNLHQNATYTQAGTFQLNGMTLTATLVNSCP